MRWMISGILLMLAGLALGQGFNSRDSNYDKNVVAAGGGSVTFNAQSSADTYALNSNSFNHSLITVGGNALVCTLQRVSGTTTDQGAGVVLTWDNAGTPQTMTLIKDHGDTGNANYSAIFGLLAPHAGTLQLHVAATNAGLDNFVGCVSFSGVNSTFGTAFPSASANFAINVTSVTCTSASNHQVVGSLQSINNGATLLGTSIYYDNINGSAINSAADYIGGGTPTVGANVNSGQLVCVDVSP